MYIPNKPDLKGKMFMKKIGINKKKKIYVSSIFTIFLSVCLTGCSLFKMPEPPVKLNEVNFTLDQDANDNSAVPVDILMIYDADMLKVLLKLESKDYYSISQQLKQDYPELADVLHWELTPGQVVKKYPIKRRSCKPVHGALIFADYYSPGPHRIRIGTSKKINVHFKKKDFCIAEQGCIGNPGSDMSKQSQAFESNFKFSDIKVSDPSRAIAQVEAIKQAKKAEGDAVQAQKYLENLAKFKPNPYAY